ncbi:MAG: phosphoribosyltransferase domain-containing protein [Clostridium celatum]|nr:phosphoribosyltransferase domain-containing protein [Clostridium celatum]MDU4979201.1 phosphoribosyltransferase domain-containing protein [Clostridium celatum]
MSVDINIRKNKYNLNLDDLIIMGKRINNPKRNFLFISKVLGKHIEAKPKVCKEIGLKLARLIVDKEERSYKNNEKISVIGFAETATGLGMAVASYIKNSYYITTTRECITELKSILKFEEEHSHATTHKCFPLDKDKLVNSEKIILVDDEITTGKSMINIIKELNKVTNAKKFIILSILDWRNEEHRKVYDDLVSKENINVEVLSLISGDIKVNDSAIYIDNNDEVINDTTYVLNYNVLDRIDLKTSYEKEVESYLLHTGRFGVEFNEIQALESKCKDIANRLQGLIECNEKILVLGHGENIYIPCRIASYIKGNVYFKSTTISPIYCENSDGYPIKEKHVFYHKGVKYYFYNKSEIEEKYDKVILITEDDLNIKLTNNMIVVRV